MFILLGVTFVLSAVTTAKEIAQVTAVTTEDVLNVVGVYVLTVEVSLVNVNNLEHKLVELLVGKILNLFGVVLINVGRNLVNNLFFKLYANGVVDGGADSVRKDLSVLFFCCVVALVDGYDVVKALLNVGNVDIFKNTTAVSRIALTA